MAEANMILLSHTGGELTVKVFDPLHAHPHKLKAPLEAGVTCIAAHCAGRSLLFDPDWTADLLKMFSEYPNLYGDNSALSSLNRARTIKKIMPAEIQQRILHGSDYPVPIAGIGPLLHRSIGLKDYKKARRSTNPIQRDYLLKKAMGFQDSTFTTLSKLLGSRA